MPKLVQFTNNTMVSLGVVLTLIGGVVYVTSVASEGASNTRTIEKLEKKQWVVESMATDIAVIRVKIEAIEKKVDRK